MKWLKNLGPGLLVTAAFIGPGTIITASKAGADFGFALVWALVFSIFATIVLQEMCARLGLVTRQGLGESIRTTCKSPVARVLAAGLVIAALGLGNAAFQSANILGAASGLQAITGVCCVSIRQHPWGRQRTPGYHRCRSPSLDAGCWCWGLPVARVRCLQVS